MKRDAGGIRKRFREEEEGSAIVGSWVEQNNENLFIVTSTIKQKLT